MVDLHIHFQKKDLWLLSAIVVFLAGVGFVIAYSATMSGGTPSIMGHSSDEIMVRNSSSDLVSLQNLIDQGGFGGGGMEFGDWDSTDSGQVGGSGVGLVVGTAYQAATDGYVMGTITGGNSKLYFQLGTTSTVSDLIVRQGGGRAESQTGSIVIPVPKDWYWKMIIASGSLEQLQWLPVISGGGSGGIDTYSFGGLYGKSANDGSCVYVNPFTNSCNCPSGYTSYKVLSAAQYEAPASVLYMCYKL